MTDTWSLTQQRQHNLSTFARMTTAWRKPYRTSGKRPTFTKTQMRIALAAHDKHTKESS